MTTGLPRGSPDRRLPEALVGPIPAPGDLPGGVHDHSGAMGRHVVGEGPQQRGLPRARGAQDPKAGVGWG